MIEVLGCGNIKSDSSDMRYLVVRNKQEIYDNILPFFSKYNINSEKHKDQIYEFWVISKEIKYYVRERIFGLRLFYLFSNLYFMGNLKYRLLFIKYIL